MEIKEIRGTASRTAVASEKTMAKMLKFEGMGGKVAMAAGIALAVVLGVTAWVRAQARPQEVAQANPQQSAAMPDISALGANNARADGKLWADVTAPQNLAPRSL